MSFIELAPLVVAGAALLAMVAIDLHASRLPDLLNAILAITGAAFHWTTDWLHAIPADLLLGASFGAALLYAVRVVYLRLRGVEALGLGDVKFMAAAGLWVGIWGIAPLILIAALTTLTVVLLRHGRAVTSEAVRRRRIPFGPGLALGLAVVVAGQVFGVWPG
jgi:prepilin signal peptidase PulO-like enzyme (type II secretory pathway)